MMSFMVCMKQALQNRYSLSHEFSNDSTRLSLRFVDWSAVGCLRLIGAWNEMHSILITPFTKAKTGSQAAASSSSSSSSSSSTSKPEISDALSLKSPFKHDKNRFQNVA
ncbi:unnamed protein product [Sphagnum jensenii]|uniref:Uncharacterized protein n=1 Tax=Sphagnum jensenii TaxID=128206 RepID=A0ABP1AE88_9BRYO